MDQQNNAMYGTSGSWDEEPPTKFGLGMLKDRGILGTAQTGLDALQKDQQQRRERTLNFGNKILYGNHPPAPTPTVAPPTVAPPPVAPPPGSPLGQVNLGGGSSISVPYPMDPKIANRMQLAATPSTPEQLASRAESAALADQRYADWHAQRDADAARASTPQVGGMARIETPDYSGAINQAVDDINSEAPSGSFDRALRQKHKVAAAQQLLSTLGGIQGQNTQNITHTNIADANNRSTQDIAYGNQQAQAQAQKAHSALGMGQLASEDQYRVNQNRIASDNSNMSRQLAETEAAKAAAARSVFADQLRTKAKGMFFDNQDQLNNAELVRSGAVTPDAMFKQLNK